MEYKNRKNYILTRCKMTNKCETYKNKQKKTFKNDLKYYNITFE